MMANLYQIIPKGDYAKKGQYLSCIIILIVLIQLLIKTLVIVNPTDLVQSMLADLFSARQCGISKTRDK